MRGPELASVTSSVENVTADSGKQVACCRPGCRPRGYGQTRRAGVILSPPRSHPSLSSRSLLPLPAALGCLLHAREESCLRLLHPPAAAQLPLWVTLQVPDLPCVTKHRSHRDFFSMCLSIERVPTLFQIPFLRVL